MKLVVINVMFGKVVVFLVKLSKWVKRGEVWFW